MHVVVSCPASRDSKNNLQPRIYEQVSSRQSFAPGSFGILILIATTYDLFATVPQDSQLLSPAPCEASTPTPPQQGNAGPNALPP